MVRPSEGDRATIANCFIEKDWGCRRIIREFPNKRWAPSTVARIIRQIKQNNSTKRKPGSGRPRTARTQDNVNAVEELIQSQEDNPGSHKSARQVAAYVGISRRSVGRICKDLRLRPYKRIKVSRRDNNVRSKRKERCRKLLDRFTQDDVKLIMFTDEKDFTLEIAKNSQNNRVYGQNKRQIIPTRLYHETSRFTKKVMVSAGVSWNGKTDIHFIDTNNTKVNTDCYVKLLDEGLLPDCRRLYPSDDFIFQQDGAPSHTSRITQGHLEECTPVFIKKDEWPPQSPDCNPMDYAIWDLLKEDVYRGRAEKFTEQELKDAIVQSWERITLEQIRSCLSSW